MFIASECDNLLEFLRHLQIILVIKRIIHEIKSAFQEQNWILWLTRHIRNTVFSC